MTRSDFLAELEQIIDAPPGSIQGSEELATLRGWESMAKIALMAFLDREFGVLVSARELLACRNVTDLMKLSGDKMLLESVKAPAAA